VEVLEEQESVSSRKRLFISDSHRTSTTSVKTLLQSKESTPKPVIDLCSDNDSNNKGYDSPLLFSDGDDDDEGPEPEMKVYLSSYLLTVQPVAILDSVFITSAPNSSERPPVPKTVDGVVLTPQGRKNYTK
jgi:hypothetical protein